MELLDDITIAQNSSLFLPESYLLTKWTDLPDTHLEVQRPTQVRRVLSPFYYTYASSQVSFLGT